MRAAFAPLAAALIAGAALATLPATPLAAQTSAAPAGGMDETNNPADAAYIAAMRDLMVGMHRAMPTGDTDRDFVRMMQPHDQSALDIARAEVKYGRDAELKALAQTVIDHQTGSLAAMKAWQEKHAK